MIGSCRGPGETGVVVRNSKELRVFILAILLTLGCALRNVNTPLEAWDPDHGYRPAVTTKSRPLGEVLLVLAFSGGGTRAAAFSYGVLQELRDTTVVIEGERKRLLDEVDLITSVSGGSFASAYYGLFGERIFEDFETEFLRRNLQGELTRALLNPWNWMRMFNPYFDRTDLAIEIYDREIFKGATFADLQAATGPFIEINATDIAVGNRFTFFQPQFDLLCSDLSEMSVARAVAASSAVPVAFSPIRLRNYAGRCGYTPPEWLDAALADAKGSRRRYRNAKIAASYLDAHKRRYIHLLDGGISDNVGLRTPLDAVILTGGIRGRLEMLKAKAPRQIVVIVVDSQVNPEPSFSLFPNAPGIRAVLGSVTGVQINRYSFETVELMRESLKNWARELPPGPDGTPARSYLIEVAFEMLGSPEDRKYFNDLPTSFALESEQVDRLIAAARDLLRQSPEFRDLLGAIAAAPSTESPR